MVLRAFLKSSKNQNPQSTNTSTTTLHKEMMLNSSDGWYQAFPLFEWEKKFTHNIELVLSKVRMDNVMTDIYYRPVIDKLITFYQALPASEYNHHSHPGGMTEHVLDVMDIALNLKKKYFWSESGKETDVENESDVFTYAVFIACALHDIGKPLTDIDVVYRIGDKGNYQPEDVKRWYPLLGDLPVGAFYKFRHNPHRDPKAHVHIAASMMLNVIPPQGIIWLNGYPKLYQHLIHAIAGDMKKAKDLGEILSISDGESSNRSIMKGTNVDAKREAGARVGGGKKSAADIVMSMIRSGIEGGEIPINRKGAAIFISEEYVYAVSKSIIQKAKGMAKAAGYDSLPNNEVTIYSLLADAGYIDRHPETQDLVHTIHISLPVSTTETWDQQLTFLAFERKKIDPNNVLNLTPCNAVFTDVTTEHGYNSRQKSKTFALTTTNKEEVTIASNSNTEIDSDNPFGDAFSNLSLSSLFGQDNNQPDIELELNTVKHGKPDSKNSKPKSFNDIRKTQRKSNHSEIITMTPKPTKTNKSKPRRLTTIKAEIEEVKSNQADDTDKVATQLSVNGGKIEPVKINGFTAESTKTNDISLGEFMLNNNLQRLQQEFKKMPPTASNFIKWLEICIQAKFIKTNKLKGHCEVFNIVEGLFLCSPSVFNQYNEQNNKEITSSQMINLLKKEKYIHIGIGKKNIRTMHINHKKLSGVIIKKEIFKLELNELPASQYTLIP